LRAPARRAVARRRAGGAGPRARRPLLGDIALVELAVQGLDAPILARVREADVPPQGAEIGVSIDAGAVLVFEAENGERPLHNNPGARLATGLPLLP